MALPAVTKTYQYNVNNTIAAGGSILESCQKTLLALKNALVGFATLPWTVVGSCNSVASGMDAVDRWSVYTDLIWHTGVNAKSWIVLKNTGIAANWQICFHLITNAPTAAYYMEMVVSPSSGFTGGSTTARPTAADEIIIKASPNINWMGTLSVAVTTITHVMKSTDGKVTRWFVANAGKIVSYFSVEEAADPVTGWTAPVIVTTPPYSSLVIDHPTYANLYSLSTALNGYHSGVKFGCYATAEGFVNDANGEQLNVTANEFSNEWMMGPVGIASTQAGYRGRHGRFYDLWWGTTLHENGTTFPADTSRQFALLGDLIVPWNGTIPVVS